MADSRRLGGYAWRGFPPWPDGSREGALSRLLRAKGYDVKPYSSSQVFLEEHDEAIPGCAILDVSMPDLDGLKIQDVLTTASG